MNNLVTMPQGLLESSNKMIVDLAKRVPLIEKSLQPHLKGRTQFQANILDIGGAVSGTTKLRNLRAVLAKYNESMAGLEDASFMVAELELKISVIQNDLQAQSGAVAKFAEIELSKLRVQRDRVMKNIEGAVRKLYGYAMQIETLENAIKVELGVDEITELHFEQDEERHHIMKAFEQALHAYRTIGNIDEGNNIYLFQIGINGGMALRDVRQYILEEKILLDKGTSPVEMFRNEFEFLEKMSNKYAGCSECLAQMRGMKSIVETALLEE